MGRPFDPAQSRRERLLHRYITAFDAGDLDGIDDILLEAERDPLLSRQLSGVNEALFESTGLPPVTREHLPVLPLPLSRRQAPASADSVRAGLTVGAVAAQLDVERSAVSEADRFANHRLLRDETPLPEAITVRTVAELASRLGVDATKAYWEAFRQAALMLSMASSRPASGAGFMAARQRHPTDADPAAPTTSPRTDDQPREPRP